jgi:septal ring factor EnvC (AmiA/AmiB activator)
MQEWIEDTNMEINNIDQENDQFTMTNEEISKRSTEILNQMSELQSELKELRSNCRHAEYSTKVKEGGLRNVCDTCSKIVGYPTDKEIIQWKNS